MNRNQFIGLLFFLFLFAEFSNNVFAAEATQKKQSAYITIHPRVVYYFASWCSECSRFEPVLRKAVSNYHGYINLIPINIDPKNKLFAKRARIHSIPKILVYSTTGKLVYNHSGYVEESALNQILTDVYKELLPK